MGRHWAKVRAGSSGGAAVDLLEEVAVNLIGGNYAATWSGHDLAGHLVTLRFYQDAFPGSLMQTYAGIDASLGEYTSEDNMPFPYTYYVEAELDTGQLLRSAEVLYNP